MKPSHVLRRAAQNLFERGAPLDADVLLFDAAIDLEQTRDKRAPGPVAVSIQYARLFTPPDCNGPDEQITALLLAAEVAHSEGL